MIQIGQKLINPAIKGNNPKYHHPKFKLPSPKRKPMINTIDPNAILNVLQKLLIFSNMFIFTL